VTSGTKINANRENARASTGPKTAQGRGRSARNALRHALSLPVYSDPNLEVDVEALALKIAGPGASADTRERARRIAEAQVDLRRIRYVRHELLSEAWNSPNYESKAIWQKKIALVHRCARIDGPLTPMPFDVVEFFFSKPTGSWKFATIMLDKAQRLLALDRYERRALSRRKFAVRAFDMALRKPMS
jgi:hypothetical protein